MPTYEYRCPDGHETERFYRKMSDASSEIECPVCGKTATRKVSGGAGLLFKGSGFYLTDYGKNAHRRSGPDTKSSASSDTGASSSGGSEKKPDAGAPSKPAESKPAEKPAAKPSAESKSPPSKKSDS